jgi:hypothetical protein
MPSYLVETYLARGEAGDRPAREQRIRSAVAELTRPGRCVQFVQSIHIPEDEICFYVFVAPSAADAALVARCAAVETVRVVEAVTSGKEHR